MRRSPLAVKFSDMSGMRPQAKAAFAACSRCSFRSSIVDEMKTTGA